MVSFSSEGGPLGLMLSLLVSLILIASWVILAGSRFVQGGVVEHPHRVPQLYGYTACLIGLIWGLTSLVSLVEDALSLSAPHMRGVAEYGWEPSVTSFEAFRATYDRARQMSSSDARVNPDIVPEADLRRRYEALRADRSARGRYQAHREIVTGVLSLAIAVALFVFHWRWLRARQVA